MLLPERTHLWKERLVLSQVVDQAMASVTALVTEVETTAHSIEAMQQDVQQIIYRTLRKHFI